MSPSSASNILNSLVEVTRQLAKGPLGVALRDTLDKRESLSIGNTFGSTGSMLAAVMAELQPDRCTVVVLPQNRELSDWGGEIESFGGTSLALFPAWDIAAPQNSFLDASYGERLRMLKRFQRREFPRVLVTSIQALQQPVPDCQELTRQVRYLRVGESLDIDHFARWLIEHQYTRTTAVELPGEFSIRGGILDLFATDWEEPVRIEWFGDEIESIRRFDRASQRSLAPLPSLELTMVHAQTPATGNVASYLPAETQILLQDLVQLQSEGDQYRQRLQNPEEVYASQAVFQQLSPFPLVKAWDYLVPPLLNEQSLRLPVESVTRFQGEVATVRAYLDEISRDDVTTIVCQTEAEVARLREIFAGSAVAQQERLWFGIGPLRHGFRLPDSGRLILSGAELFGRSHLTRGVRRHATQAIDSFLDLREGDLVVHLGHGIARYRGLKVIDRSGQTEEHLELEFDGGTKIFVPATRIDLVQKYVGGRKGHPRLAKIGGKLWQKQRQAAADAATDFAAEMLELQAERESQTGISLRGDTVWQQEFDASFPYHETPDQWTAIEAIKADLSAPRAMDRLLCGDVGFGKTEVAMRAAFKAVDNGYQVAVLVPTTILAEQHYRTFRQRLAEFPFHIAKMSRFCSPQEQRLVLDGLKAGHVDIVIGTHRIASRDMAFHNLGLLIIDEEQRFGVAVKDRLKQLRSTVNVLTLSATPIPRTLHMALTGLRGISNLETPPEERLAVETRVTSWDDQLIRRAMLHELSRNGQVHFVHNRVQDIENVRLKLAEIVPEARIGIGHGQMPEEELEQVMIDFVEQKYDVLLATTIIESGLDIPNANTIFINEAHRYGLADLHQLRGRVGRYNVRAHCYLLAHASRGMTPDAARRLRAIEEYSQMGAGFSIAMRDLEIRGAGNVLGTQQSGHIATVGYELYCQLLEGAVRRLRSLPPKMEVDVTIDLPGESLLPSDYIPDLRAKIDLYRRIARTFDEAGLSEIQQELRDRFGELPPPVTRLLQLCRLKGDMASWQLRSLHREPPYLVFQYGDRSRAELLARRSQGKLRIVDQVSIYATIPNEIRDADAIIRFARQALADVASENKPGLTKSHRGQGQSTTK